MVNKIKSILIIFLMLFVCVSLGACGDDKKSKDDKVEITTQDKDTAISEVRDFVKTLDSSEYSTENWAVIQNLLIDVIANISAATSETELKNYVNTFKSTVGFVQKLPIQGDEKWQDVPQEVWDCIVNSIIEATSVADFGFKYDLRTTGSSVGSYLEDLNFDFEGIISQTNNQYYLKYNDKQSVNFEGWLVSENSQMVNSAYIDVESTDLTGKYYLSTDELFNYLWEEIFGISFDPNFSIPDLKFDFDISGIIDSFIKNPSVNDQEKLSEDNYLFEELEKDLLKLFKSSSESKMCVKESEILVTIHIDKEKIIKNNPEFELYVTNDIDIEIIIINEAVSKIVIVPEKIEVEIPDDPDEEVNQNSGLSVIDKIQISFKDKKINNVYAFTLNGTIAIGMAFKYEDLAIPAFNKDEFKTLDVEGLVKDKEFKDFSKMLVNSYITYRALGANYSCFEEYYATFISDETLVYLVKHSDIKLYNTKDGKDYYVLTEDYFGKYKLLPIPNIELLEDRSIVTTLVEIPFDINKVISYFVN